MVRGKALKLQAWHDKQRQQAATITARAEGNAPKLPFNRAGIGGKESIWSEIQNTKGLGIERTYGRKLHTAISKQGLALVQVITHFFPQKFMFGLFFGAIISVFLT